jgi:transcriptional regulator GlxA family with amidase domain
MLTTVELAKHAHMSERTFARKFHAETGLSPRKWITQQRVVAARRLLETTDLTIDDVASAVGYSTATSLRRHLTAQLGVAPNAYRQAHHVRG